MFADGLSGRTARIGNEGLATSFYNDADSDIAADLVKILVESGQAVPDFLQGFKPDTDVLTFDDDTDNEDDTQQNNNGGDTNNSYAGGDAWGVSETTTQPTADNSDVPQWD